MKKFLSLVLALIMTMSLVTIGAGATEYRDLTDKDEIQYEEAVAVLNRIGVITGYEDGSFRPETELTRGAAAKIIVSLLIGPEAASNLPNATAPYPDVPASHTFAGVISYCKTAGIISGYGDGTFKPGNSLTGFAFAKMLLGALGYKSEIEGFVDTGWTMNVARVGNVTGLFDRLDFDGSAAVNREEACQLALNTLKATMVTYGGTTLVTGAQALAVQGTQAMYVTSNNREINANINRRVISATNNEMTLEFGEEHFKDLRLEHDKYDPAYDEYGHPSDEWSWKKVTIGTFPLPADFTYTKLMSHLEDTDATKEKALGLRNYDTYSIDHRSTYSNWSSVASSNNVGYFQTNSPFADATQIHINGWKARVDKNGKIQNYDATSLNSGATVNNALKAQAPTIAEIADLTDNGVTVEVYVCPVDADFITDVVVTRTQLMKIKRIGSDTITLEDIEPDSRDPRKDPDLTKITGYNNFAIDVTEDYDSKNKGSFLADVKDSNYDAYNALKDMKAGDRVAVIPYTTDNGKTWEVGEAYAPETVSGALTQVETYANVNKRDGSAVSITVGGTTYPINEWNKDMLDVTGNKIKATKKDVTLYLAKDGTALWADEIGNSDAWMVVGDYYQATNPNGKVDWYVHGWTIGGVEVDLDLGTIRGEAEIYAPGELVYYNIAETSNGEYQLSKPNNRTDKGTFSPGFSLLNDSTAAKEHRKDEPAWKDDDGNYTGEGAYEIAQISVDQGTGKNVKTRLTSRTGAVPLELYSRTKNSYTLWDTATAVAGGDKAEKIFNKVKGSGYPVEPHDFKYYNLPYNGVKFIFVNFAQNGEVETIDFRSGPQNVEYNDLIRFNKDWRNNATNVDNFVVSAAEAYVNDKGEVKAVVVKTDSGEADTSKIAVITATYGDKYWNKNTNSNLGAEGDRPAGMSYQHEYVCGPSFSLSDAKVGVFDKWYQVGDILVISEKDGVISGKKFHAASFNNGNPDAVYVEGVNAVLRPDGKDAGIGFTIGQKKADGAECDSTVYVLNKAAELFYDKDKNTETYVTSNDRTIDLLGNKYTVAYDTKDNNLKGLVTVDGNTTFVDLRPGEHNNIEDLDDLMDYDHDTIKLRLLVNTKVESNTFRHAYAVIVENAVKSSVATKPVVDLDVIANSTEWARTKTDGTTYTYEVPADTQVTLVAAETHDETKMGTLTATWSSKLSALTATSGWTTKVQSNAVPGKSVTVTLKVTNTDTSKLDEKISSTEYTIILVSKNADPTPGAGKVTDKVKTDNEKFGTGIDPDKSVKANANGQFTVAFSDIKYADVKGAGKYQIPADKAGGTLYFKTYVNGVEVGSEQNTDVMAGLGRVAPKQVTVSGLDADDEIKVEITKIEWKEVMVHYVYTGAKATQAQTAGLKDGYTKSLKAGVYKSSPSTGELDTATNQIKFILNANTSSTTQGAIVGGTYGTTTTGFGNPTEAAGVDADGTTQAVIDAADNTTVTGDAPVVVTIDTDSLTLYDQQFTVTGITTQYDLNDDFSTLTDNVYKITVAPGTQPVGKTAGEATVNVISDAVPVANKAIEITLVLKDADGNEVSNVSKAIVLANNNTASNEPVELTGITASGTVAVKSATELPALTVASVGGSPAGTAWAAGDKIVVRFSEALSSTKTTLVAGDCQGDGAVLKTAAVTAIAVSGNELTLTLAAPDSNDGVTGTIAIPTGKLANEKGVVNSTAITITFAAATVS